MTTENQGGGDVKDIVKTLLEVQILRALKESPETIDLMIKAALSKPVDRITGKLEGYSSDRIPYLEYMVGEEIRHAAKTAVHKLIGEEYTPIIEQKIRDGLQADAIVDAMTKSFVAASHQDWRITVNFDSGRK
jgi:hypothetical protein